MSDEEDQDQARDFEPYQEEIEKGIDDDDEDEEVEVEEADTQQDMNRDEIQDLQEKLKELEEKIASFKEDHTMKSSKSQTQKNLNVKLSCFHKIEFCASNKPINNEEIRGDEEGEEDKEEVKKVKKDKSASTLNGKEEKGPPVSVPCISFNMCDEFENQFCIIDEQGKVAIHEFNKNKKKTKLKAEKYVSNAILEC